MERSPEDVVPEKIGEVSDTVVDEVVTGSGMTVAVLRIVCTPHPAPFAPTRQLLSSPVVDDGRTVSLPVIAGRLDSSDGIADV